MPHAHRPNRSRRSSGFTLVELLVVIGIIVVLIGILIPVVGHIRLTSYVTATASRIQVIQAGIEQYQQTFGAYPGPLADSQIQPAMGPNSPTSSENLTLGLLGGWSRPVAPATAIVYNYLNVGLGPDNLGLKVQRYQPFIDAGAAGLDPHKKAGVWVNWNDPSRTDVQNAANYKDSVIPEFVDAFPQAMPILYVRARIGATGVVMSQAGTVFPTNTIPAYDAQQLYPYGFPNLTTTPNSDFANPQQYFGNTANSFLTPKQRDGYFLIAAGADRLYGTADDVTNVGKLK